MNSEPFLQLDKNRYYPALQQLKDGNGVELTIRSQSLDVLDLLAKKPDQLISKDEIIKQIWKDVSVTDDSLVQCIADVRRALGDKKHKILQTVQRRGYKLVPSPVVETAEPTTWQGLGYFPHLVFLLIATVALLGLLSIYFGQSPSGKTQVNYLAPASSENQNASTLAVSFAPDIAANRSRHLAALMQEMRVALGRYRSIRLVNGPEADYQLTLNEHELGNETTTPQITMELNNPRENSTVFAESYDLPEENNAVAKLAIRAASAVASPGAGAIGSHLLRASRLKPVNELTPAECYSYGYGCTKCSGEEDNIDHRAQACLTRLLKQNPSDARAWGLQATIYTHQYWFGSTLSEPARSNLALRKHLPAKAIEAANKAEALSDGKDSSVYWGMAQAYMASCQPEKLYEAAKRGLAINPDDPNLLASFGNWLAYSGYWDEGAAMTQKALEIEPQHFKKWWLMSIAKRHYKQDEHELAYQTFVESFNERNWLSHLQLAYSLPLLGRTEDAQKALKELQRHYPGFTLEHALEFYKMFCFDDAFVNKIKRALVTAGMPSRGNSDDLSNIQLPVAKTVKVNGINVEYMDIGKGEPIVFVHGAVSDYRTWGHYLLPISEKHRYISYSRRYYGTQPWPDKGEQWSSDTFTADLVEFIETLAVGPVHLVSWSSGAVVANLAAVQRPDLVKSAIHYEPVTNSIMSGNAIDEALREDWLSKWGKWSEFIKQKDNESAAAELINIVFELPDYGFQDETELSKELIHNNAENLSLGFTSKGSIQIDCDYLKKIQSPSLIVLGETTHAYWTRMSQKFAECTPNASLEIMKGVNHKGPILDAPAFSKLIINFVEAHK